MNNVTITGKNIYIRTMTLDDTESIIEWRNSKRVMDNFIMQTPLTREMHENWYHGRIETGQVVQFIIGIVTTSEEIGSVYLRDISKDTLDAEFGIFIGTEGYDGLGYGQEALDLISRYAKDTLGLKKLKLRVRGSNAIAMHVYTKAGFKEISKEKAVISGFDETIVFMIKDL